MIRLEIPYMPHEGQVIPLAGLKIPFGRQQNPNATLLREIEVPGAIALHTAVPFSVEEIQKDTKSLRNHIAAAWGMTIPGDVDVRVYAKGVRIGSPDHFVWSWIQNFFEVHGQKAMKIVAPPKPGIWGNILWQDDRPAKEFVLLPIKDRDIHFGFSNYRMKDRLKLEEGAPQRKSPVHRPEATTQPV